jgi:MYXO-CTERM domain-containing protein
MGSFNLVTPADWSQSYLFFGNNGFDLQLMLIPEPSVTTLATGTLTLVAALRLRRRRG